MQPNTMNRESTVKTGESIVWEPVRQRQHNLAGSFSRVREGRSRGEVSNAANPPRRTRWTCIAGPVRVGFGGLM